MTAWIAGQHRHDRIRGRIDDGNGRRERIRRDHAFPIGTYRGLNRQGAHRARDGASDGIIVFDQVDGFHDDLGLRIDYRDRAGVSATRPRDSDVRTAQRVGVKELERWPNNWGQVTGTSGYYKIAMLREE
jgi:hypothetical protein